MSNVGQNEQLTITAEDGVNLEAEVLIIDEPKAAAVICHPHPLYGGNMYNNVVGGLFSGLPKAGVTPLRFNFRGVGASTGSHGDGAAEKLDIEAAVKATAAQHPGLPILLCGYSFGADIALSVTDQNISGWFAVAPPLRVIPLEDMAAGQDPRPKHLTSGTADDFRPAGDLPDVIAGWPNHRITPVEGATHFFSTGLDVVTAAALEFAAEIIG